MSKQNSLKPERPQNTGHGHGPGAGMGRPVEKAKDLKGTLTRLFKYIGNNKYLLIMLMIVVVLTSAAAIVLPLIQARAIDAITITDKRLKVDFTALMRALALIAALATAYCALNYIQSISVAYLANRTIKKLRQDLFVSIEHLPISYIDRHPHGDIMSRMTNDAENISNTISQSLTSLISGALTILGTVAMMLYLSPLMTLISLSTVILTVFATAFLSKFMRVLFPRQQKLLGELNAHIEESVSGHSTIIAYSREPRVQSEFNEISGSLKRTGIKAQIVGSLMGPVMNVIGNIGFLIVAGFGGAMALAGSISVGTIQAFIQYTRQFNRPISELANQIGVIQTALAGAERVFEIMDTPPETDKGTHHIDSAEMRGNISFQNVNFSYIEGEQVLHDFTLDIYSGHKIALVGATGSGKTTVVNLLTRFYDADSGTISIDGINVLDIPKQELRRSVAIVLQDTVIFSDTIAANIRYGKLDASDEEVIRAAKTARVDSFVSRLPEGYATMLDEGGANLSQGQRQLISIARAVLANPDILILDEATSSIDTRTEMHIQEAMLSLMQNRTSLIIAHRLSTIRDADHIVVMEHGRIVESGNHEQLIARGGVYNSLYESQFAGIET